ncbi:unnamed protein product [Sphagnum balticum]
METQVSRNSLSLLQLYEKIKYFVVVANKNYRKDQHYAFNLWRGNAQTVKRMAEVLDRTLGRALPRLLVRNYFRRWLGKAEVAKRLDTATLLLG